MDDTGVSMGKRPTVVRYAALLIYLAVIIGIVNLVYHLYQDPNYLANSNQKFLSSTTADVNTWTQTNQAVSQLTPTSTLLFFGGLGFIFYIWLGYMIYLGKNWARYIFLGLMLFKLFGIAIDIVLFQALKDSALISFLRSELTTEKVIWMVLPSVCEFAALILVFTRAASPWFKKQV